MLWLMGLAFAEITLLSNEVDKAQSSVLETQCEKQLMDSQTLVVRTSRFFMPGKGFRYRLVVDTIDSLDEAATVRNSLKVVPLDFTVVVDGKELTVEQPTAQPEPFEAEEPKRIIQQEEKSCRLLRRKRRRKKTCYTQCR